MAKLKVALIGAGQRGKYVYGDYALNYPDQMEFIAVAEPDEERLAEFSRLHDIEASMQFTSWEELLSKPKLCDAVIIATQDRMHFNPVIAALRKGYDVLLEKPMSNDPKECFLMAEEAKKQKRILMIGHVLRYTPFFSKIKDLLDSRKIGRLVSIQHIEKVGYWHQAHSFVRGNWRNSDEASPMILAKSCHDLDILSWLADKKCVKISSFGGLNYFREENSPEGSTLRCTDGCKVENTCPYSAIKLYVGKSGWPSNVVSSDTSPGKMLEALKSGPYGRCVFKCDNNVVDNQVVNIEFEGGISAAFTMCAFTKETSRRIHLMGTDGEITGNLESNSIEVYKFSTNERETIYTSNEGGHSGGDPKLIHGFIELLNSESKEGSLTTADKSMESHLMAFAAEKARLENKVIWLDEFKAELANK